MRFDIKIAVMQYWQMMKEDITEIRKQTQRFGLSDYCVVIKNGGNLEYKLGMINAVERLVKKKVLVADENEKIVNSIPAATRHNAYYLIEI